MFTSLINWFESLWTAFVTLTQTIWNYCQKGYFWVVGVMVAFLAVTHQVTTFIYTAILGGLNAAAQMSDALHNTHTMSAVAQHALTWLQIANTFFPVEEGFTLITTYSLVLTICIIYRLIKSWIPTLS